MGIGANVFLVGLVGVGYYVYATIDPTRADYPSPVSELFARVSVLPAIPSGVKTMWIVAMPQFNIKVTSETDKSVSWTYRFKDEVFGVYTVNFVPNGEKSTTVFCAMEAFEPNIPNSSLTSGDWDVLRSIAADVTYEQVSAAIDKRATSLERVRKHQGRILANLKTVNRLKALHAYDYGFSATGPTDRMSDAKAEAEMNAAVRGEADVDVGSAE
jgi:hypothetical protein